MTENKHSKRSQSAMEYLMTYGWAILIIAVALGLLYVLGLFSPSSSTSSSCTSQSGYVCTDLSFSYNGIVTLEFGQDTGTTLYNLEFTCTALESSAGLPSPKNDFVVSPARTVINSQKFYVSMPCYTSYGTRFSSTQIGTPYTGYIWINYTQANQPPGNSNPWLTAKIAAFSTKTTN
ncbi:MAG: hypothetical protein M1564_00850 [Candidatus Marsarchaeota archaeon]|nr:hypothetical protein [Candidatus Marsarchaeota archaeon]MCL5430833.1 hypothetical protein [Candidatus Marsarchaeota archaeon]